MTGNGRVHVSEPDFVCGSQWTGFSCGDPKEARDFGYRRSGIGHTDGAEVCHFCASSKKTRWAYGVSSDGVLVQDSAPTVASMTTKGEMLDAELDAAVWCWLNSVTLLLALKTGQLLVVQLKLDRDTVHDIAVNPLDFRSGLNH